MSNSAKRGWLTSMLIMVGTNCACVTFSRGDGLQHLDRLEARHEGVAAADQRDAEGRGAVGEMEHRAGMDVGGVGVEAHAGDRVHRVHHEVGVGQHHALGPAGRAAGVEQAGEVVVGRADILGRLVGGEVLVVQHAVGRGDVVEPDHLAHARHPAVERGQVVRHRAVDEQRHGAGVLRGCTRSRAPPAGC